MDSRVLRKLPRWVAGVKWKTPPRKGPSCAHTLLSQESLGERCAQTRDLTEQTSVCSVCPSSHGVHESHMVPNAVIFLY